MSKESTSFWGRSFQSQGLPLPVLLWSGGGGHQRRGCRERSKGGRWEGKQGFLLLFLFTSPFGPSAFNKN